MNTRTIHSKFNELLFYPRLTSPVCISNLDGSATYLATIALVSSKGDTKFLNRFFAGKMRFDINGSYNDYYAKAGFLYEEEPIEYITHLRL
ncbi:hypothetical protein [Candidatus Enterovibrio escicola]|uniref:hypothetical protein n=1 Tax=Candidatus Enterovibrio escicola TaxID=1927127 RepID=UPI001CC30E0E|nr:hypothetical protein [Candidatus Enterovibrio escacola]